MAVQLETCTREEQRTFILFLWCKGEKTTADVHRRMKRKCRGHLFFFFFSGYVNGIGSGVSNLAAAARSGLCHIAQWPSAETWVERMIRGKQEGKQSMKCQESWRLVMNQHITSFTKCRNTEKLSEHQNNSESKKSVLRVCVKLFTAFLSWRWCFLRCIATGDSSSDILLCWFQIQLHRLTLFGTVMIQS